MSIQTLDVILQLRRDNDYNYEKVKDTFRPLKGEVCFVDTAKDGLRCKVGDGRKVWSKLPYTDEATAANVIKREYYHDGKFYTDDTYTTEVEASENKLYIDSTTETIYIYDGSEYKAVSGNTTVSLADENTAGIMKLYSTTGENEDGAMTQKAVTEALDSKVEMTVDNALEILILST